MKCVILHESPGRLRLHAAASRMTLTQADPCAHGEEVPYRQHF